MKRILTSTLAVSLLVLLPACSKGAGADAVKLIPDGADAIGGVNLKSVTGSELYKTYAEKIPDDGLNEFKTALEGCNLKMENLEAVVVGMSPETEDFSAVIVGEGIGNKENAVCIVNKMKEKSGETDKAEVTTVDGKDVIEAEDGRMFLVSENMVALASKGWQDKVAELIDGKGKAAIDGSAKDLYSKADPKAAMWFLATVPAEMGEQAAGFAEKASAMKSFVGKVDLSGGLAVELIAGFGDDAAATGAAEELNGMVEQFGPMAGEELAGVVKSVKIEAKGSDLNLGMTATMDDIAAAAKMAGM